MRLMTVKMRGRDVARKMRSETKDKVQALQKENIFPKLAIVRVGNDKGSLGYQKAAQKIMAQVGIEVEIAEYNEDISMTDFEKQFAQINARQDVQGILLLRPLPQQLDTEKIQRAIDPHKDIDGMNPINLGKSLDPQKDDFVPLTPAAVLAMLDYYEIPLEGKKVTIIGHSLVVGRPLANMMLARNATVAVCNAYTPDNSEFTKNADLVIAAVGKTGLLTAEMVKSGVIVIDVGTNYDSAGKVTGDVLYAEVAPKAAYINPVPGGVGSITTSLLAQRVVQATEYFYRKTTQDFSSVNS